MQHRYVGDFGDYVKLAVLRALADGFQLGVAWYLFPNQSHNRDGRHIGYLSDSNRWRDFAPEVFDHLKMIVAEDRRHISALEQCFPNAVFARAEMPIRPRVTDRAVARREWFDRTCAILADADFVFADPDNGLASDNLSLGRGKAGKSILMAELQQMRAPGRCVLFYHHQTRRKGGHQAELLHLVERLKHAGFSRVDSLRAGNFSPRLFLLLDAPAVVRERAASLAATDAIDLVWRPDGMS